MLKYSSTFQTDGKVYNSLFITDHPLYASVIVLGDQNVIPVAYPDAYNVDQNGVLTVSVENGVLANDVDTDNILLAELVSDVSNGTLILNADGSFTYTPNEMYYGQDSFTYRVFDRKEYSNTETAVITVNQVVTWNELIANTHEDRVIADGGVVLDKTQLITDLDTLTEPVYDNLTLLMNPNGGSKSGKIHSIKPTDGSGDWTVDRNSTATYVGQDGLIKTALANEPRYDWSSGNPVLLVEPQRANLISYSENFSNESWKKNNGITVNSNTVISPDGTLSADTINLVDGTNSNLFKNISYVVANKTMTMSVWLKGSGTITLRLSNYVDDSINKTITLTHEWVRYKNTYTFNSTVNTTLSFDINRTGATALTYDIWGAQIEDGNITTYIKTEGSSVTRLADTITTTPPAGTTQIIETIDGVEQTPITTIPATYQVPEGNINQIKML